MMANVSAGSSDVNILYNANPINLAARVVVLMGHTNYYDWKRKFRSITNVYGLTDRFDHPKEGNELDEDDRCGMILLQATTHPSILDGFAPSPKTLFDAMQRIKANYETTQTKNLVRYRWRALHLSNCNSLDELINRIRNLALDCNDCGDLKKDQDKVQKLLKSIPTDFFKQKIARVWNVNYLASLPFEDVAANLLVAEAETHARASDKLMREDVVFP